MAGGNPGATDASAIDRQAIAANIQRHNDGRDRRDALLLKSLYRSDAAVRFGPSPIAASAWIARTCTSPDTLASRHRTFNLLVRQEGDQARSLSCCIAQVHMPDQGVQRFLGGRYLDRHVRHRDGWRIAARHFLFDWNIDLPIEEEAFASRLQAGNHHGAGKCHSELADLLHDALRSADRGEMCMPLPWLEPSSAITRSFHVVDDVRFAVEGDDAIGTCAMIAVLSVGDDVVITGWLSVAARRREGLWTIAGYRMSEEWRGSRPSSAVALPFDRGRRDRGDPAYAFWR